MLSLCFPLLGKPSKGVARCSDSGGRSARSPHTPRPVTPCIGRWTLTVRTRPTRGEATHERAWLWLPLPGEVSRQEDGPAQGVPDLDHEALGRRQGFEAAL